MVKDDRFVSLEVSIVSCATASRIQLCRGHRQWHGTARNVSEPGRPYHISGTMEYRPTSRKYKEVEMCVRESDKLIVVLKQGNACGAKGLALLCRDLGPHCPGTDLEKQWKQN